MIERGNNSIFGMTGKIRDPFRKKRWYGQSGAAKKRKGGKDRIRKESGDVIGSIKKLNEAIRHQQGIMSPESNGRGHGRLLRTIAANEGISGVGAARVEPWQW